MLRRASQTCQTLGLLPEGPARSGDIAELAQDKVFWNEKELLAMQNTDEL